MIDIDINDPRLDWNGAKMVRENLLQESLQEAKLTGLGKKVAEEITIPLAALIELGGYTDFRFRRDITKLAVKGVTLAIGQWIERNVQTDNIPAIVGSIGNMFNEELTNSIVKCMMTRAEMEVAGIVPPVEANEESDKQGLRETLRVIAKAINKKKESEEKGE